MGIQIVRMDSEGVSVRKASELSLEELRELVIQATVEYASSELATK